MGYIMIYHQQSDGDMNKKCYVIGIVRGIFRDDFMS